MDSVERISNPHSPDGTLRDDVAEVVKMKSAELGIKANAAVIRASNEMTGHLIDIVV